MTGSPISSDNAVIRLREISWMWIGLILLF